MDEPKRSPIWTELWKAAIAILVEELVRRFFHALLPYAWAGILLLATWELFNWSNVKRIWYPIFRKIEQKRPGWSHVVATLLFVGLGILYWFAIAKALEPKSEYGAMENVELQREALNLAKDMREYEATFKSQESAALDRERAAMASAATETEKQSIWNNFRSDEEQRWMNEKNGFDQQYRGKAIAIRDEMLVKRLTPKPPKPKYPIGALDNDSLAGVAAISEAADYIESLARQLPIK